MATTVANEMLVDMKMNITTCGAHSGLIVHSGIVQHDRVWPYMKQFTNTPWSSSINQLQQYNQPQKPSCEQSLSQQQQQQQNGSVSLAQTFHGNDSPSSEFIQPDNIQLSRFQLNPLDYTEPQLNRNGPKYNRTEEQRPEMLFNDGKIHSGTLEALRADVNPNASKECNRLQVPHAMEPYYYEEGITARREPFTSAHTSKWHSTNASERPRLPHPQNNPKNESSAKNSYYHAAELANNIPPSTINNRHMSVNDLTYVQQQQAHSTDHYRQSSFYPNHYSTNIEPENFYEISRSRSVEDMDRLRTAHDDYYRHHLSRPRNNVSFQDASSPTQTVRAEVARSDGLRCAATAPEEMFHLYETRDALGNIRAQCVSDIKVNERGQSKSTSLVNDDSNDSPTSRTTSNLNYPYSSYIEIPHHDQAQQFTAYNQRENNHIPYYSIKNASASNTEFENAYESFPDDLQKMSPPSKHLTQSPPLATSSSPSIHLKSSTFDTLDKNDLDTTISQSSLLDADEDQRSLPRFAQILTNPYAISSNELRKQNCTTDDRSACSRSAVPQFSNEALIGLDSKQISASNHILQQRASKLVNETRNQMSTVHQQNATTVHKMSTQNLSNRKNSRPTVSNDGYDDERLIRNGIKYNDDFSERKLAAFPSLKSKLDSNTGGGEYTITEELMQKSSVAHHSIPSDNFSYENSPQMIHHCVDQHLSTIQDRSPSCSYSLKNYAASTNSVPRIENAAFGTVLAKSHNDDALIDQNESEMLNLGFKHSAKNDITCPQTTIRNSTHCSSSHDNNNVTELIQVNSTDGSDVTASLNDHSTTPLLSEIATKQSNEKSSKQVSDIKLLNKHNDGGTVTQKRSTASSSADGCLQNDPNSTQQDSNYSDAIAAPSKSILHSHSKKSVRHSKRNKSVSFPFQPQVIVNEHRLFITNIDDSDSSDNSSKNQ
ncbi:unnamed protein product [Anisakis simplex]|uniref:GATA-type domain-containing protein n=1 Tax=Anisakis simplex TaxID=6269 RepID=A0A0M3JWY3_ANISI|nr:unnamed protein product [Anisakis simplex]